MPCPVRFRESLEQFNIPREIVEQINNGVICVHAVHYVVGNQFSCACSNFNKTKYEQDVRKD